MRWPIALAVLLASCSAKPAPQFTFHCPASPLLPALKPIKTLQPRTEVAREAEHERGDACADAVTERDRWIAGHR